MSYILKALKKLEEEKVALRTKTHDINCALLAADRKPTKPARTPCIVAILALALIAGSGSVYFLLRHTPPSTLRTQDPAAEATSRDKQSLQLQAPPPLPAGSASEPEKKPAAGKSDAGQKLALPAPSGKSPDAGTPLPSRNPVTAPTPPSQQSSQEPSGAAPSGLKVSGIALQDDPSESLAVVNGILVRRGMTILDSRVEEIFHDRVRFSGNGQSYEVYISK
jgi:hypothetical protein